MLKELQRRYWTEASWALRIMLIALVAFTLILFLPFREAGGTGSLYISANYDTVGTYFLTPGGSGWDLHPWAYVLLVSAFMFYLSDFHLGAFWRKFGWWLTPVLLFTCMWNGDNSLLPPWLALGSLCLMLLAAALNFFDQHKLQAVAVAPTEAPKSK